MGAHFFIYDYYYILYIVNIFIIIERKINFSIVLCLFTDKIFVYNLNYKCYTIYRE